MPRFCNQRTWKQEVRLGTPQSAPTQGTQTRRSIRLGNGDACSDKLHFASRKRGPTFLPNFANSALRFRLSHPLRKATPHEARQRQRPLSASAVAEARHSTGEFFEPSEEYPSTRLLCSKQLRTSGPTYSLLPLSRKWCLATCSSGLFLLGCCRSPSKKLTFCRLAGNTRNIPKVKV